MNIANELKRTRSKVLSGLIGASVLTLVPLVASGQDRDRGRGGREERLDPGTTISVRTSEGIDVDQSNHRVFRGVLEEDVRGEGGRIAIPRGSPVELMVRVARDNDLILDLDSVVVHGERFAVRADPNRVESSRDTGVVGAIVGALGGEVRGRAVRVPRDTIVTFRLDRPLDVGVLDRGYDRDGHHYHGDERDGNR